MTLPKTSIRSPMLREAVSHKLPLLQMPVLSPGPPLLLTDYTLGVPMPPSLGSVICQNGSQNSEKYIYFLVYYKEYSSGRAKYKRCIGQGMEAGRGRIFRVSMPSLGCVPSQHFDVFTNLETLQILSFRGFGSFTTQARLIKLSTIGD